MDANKFTDRTQQALQNAQSLSARLSQQQVDNEHLLVALLEQENGLAPTILLKAGVQLEPLHRKLMQELERLPKVQVAGSGGPGAAGIGPIPGGCTYGHRMRVSTALLRLEAARRHRCQGTSFRLCTAA